MAESIGPAMARYLDNMGGPRSSTPRRSYNRKSPGAQLRHLSRTKAGREALDLLGVSPRTIKAWSSGKRAPNKANREKLASTYERLAGRAPRQFPQRARSQSLNFRGLPWENDPRGERSIDFGTSDVNWDQIAAAYERGDLHDDESYADELVTEATFGFSIGGVSTEWEGGVVFS